MQSVDRRTKKKMLRAGLQGATTFEETIRKQREEDKSAAEPEAFLMLQTRSADLWRKCKYDQE